MTYTYTILAPPLHPTGDAAIQWFKDHWGLKSSSIRVEQPLHPDINLRPTFSAKTRDFYTLCIEVSESVYPNYLDAFVLDCRNRGMPIKLFVAVRKGEQEREYAQKLKAAKNAGVGILEVDENSGTIIQNALSLSLTGVRPIDVLAFPKKYRQDLIIGEQTFRDGNPVKACSDVYDELEALFRKFSSKVASKGWWPNSNGYNLVKHSWAQLITDVDEHLNRAACSCPKLTRAFMARIHGVTPFRNDSGHKPSNVKALIKRDRELRTRFESAVDLFYDFVDATKALRL